MANRPKFIDLRSQSQGQTSTVSHGLPSPSLRSLPSPRLHVAGDIPPELSPLDAFAAQSRLLARQLNESTNGGKRISRLPPLTIANSLGQNRLGSLRSASAERVTDSPLSQFSPADSPGASAGPGQQRTEVDAPVFRPVSVHPEVGKVPDTPVFDIIPEKEEGSRGRRPPPSPREQSVFGARRDLSPPSIDQDHRQLRQRPGRSPSDAPYRGRSSPQPCRSPSAPHQGRNNLRPERSPSAPNRGPGRSPRPGRSPSGPHNNRPLRPERSPSDPQKGRMGRPGRSPSDGTCRGPRSPRPGRSPSDALSRPSQESMRQRAPKGPDGSLAVGGYGPRALAPPRAPFVQRAPSSKAISMESSDDDHSLSHNSPQRKLSSTSAVSSTPNSPSMVPSVPPSPSVSSEYSVDHMHLPRPAFNFSRPMSRSSNNPAEDTPLAPSRQASSDSQPSFILTDDTAHTPVSMHSEGFPDHNLLGDGGAPSYLYSKFSLPRGKMLQRSSAIFQEGQPQAQSAFEPQPPAFVGSHIIEGGPPPSPPSRPSTSSKPNISHTRPSLEHEQGSPKTTTLAERGRSLTDSSIHPGPFDAPPTLHPDKSKTHTHAPSVASSNTTIKARSQHSLAPSAEMSGEEHVAKAIEYHEEGSLTKSTYHLRLAARQNHPTGMLLYALACRHGWGMRPNQREGVAWLRKAADSASLEVADDEDTAKDGKAVDVLERKTRKAQFALSIYELGVSHMNGWGIEQDKTLALRCFEIAGSWGDGDALAEAGFCYAQGVGCKKNLKKSAKFYRAAESKGISMIGNSWIYKSKYNDDGKDEVGGSPNGKKGGKDGHKRNLFGRTK